ncbi:hypothetical protein FANTH_1761 [Fusarium anthophilum]|uniref:LysM domain-containing protein n=1 Tax=Fusarium anthophilum TaxID=48485 RepID=A0A8H4ZV54_9HYPO|nr:hypothetical protein FANTH_1761 [Fusarium anthophilum]
MQLFLLGTLSLLFQSSHGSSSRHQRRDDTPSMPIAPGTTQSCASWYDNDGSLPCELIPYAWNLSLEDLIRWNPSITAECGNFKEGFSYCIQEKEVPVPVSSTTTKFTTAPPSSTTLVPSKTTPTKPSTTAVGGNGVETPNPIQPGMVSNCNKFYFVEQGDNCNAVSSKHGITLAQFTTWNPKLGTGCSGLWADVWVCVSVIGHTATPTQSTKPTNGIETPSPIQAENYYKLPLKDFYSWNPAVGTNCQSLLVDYWVCVSVVGWTAPTPTTPSNGITTPTPIQTGMTKNCNKFHTIKSTTTCASIQDYYKISFADFYAWNPAIGSTCTSLLVGYNVCVGIIGQQPSPTSTGNGITTPTPIQAGMTKSCNKFHTIKSTTTCSSIQNYYKISFADFYAWNPAIGSKCTALWVDYNVCVGVVGQTPTPTQPSNGVATPSPIQSGITKNCKKFHQVKSTTTCASIQNYYKITMANLFKWNPAIGSTCTSFAARLTSSMDDLLAISKSILDKVPRLQALDNYFRTPEILARQQRVDQLEELAQQNAKRFREDTAGKIDIRPFRTLILEQSKLEEEIEKDKARFLQQLLDDWGTTPEGLLALAAPTSQAPRDPLQADPIPTPSRAPLPAYSIPTPARSSVVHDSLERAGPERDATAESQAPLADNAERIPSRKPRTSASRRRSSNISLDENRPVKRSRRGQITPSLTPDRFIKFSEVFQGGDTPAKYRIVQFPFRQGNWYILECKDCDVQFQGEDVVEDAYDHFYHNHGRSFSTTEEQVVQVLGTHVSDCNAELAEKNNALCPLPVEPDGDETELETEDEEPEEPSERRRRGSTRKKKGKRGRRKNPNAHWVPPKSFKDVDPRMINAKPGDIVCLYNDRTKFFSPLMILPWGPFPRLKFDKVLQEIELHTTIPKCYDGAKPTDLTPSPWAPGYEDGGDLAHKRSLPGLFFRPTQDFPHDCRSGWVPLNKLKVYDKTCPRTRNKESVEEYFEYYAEWCNDPPAVGKQDDATAPKRNHRFRSASHRGPKNSSRDQSVRLSTAERSRHSMEEDSVAPTIEDAGFEEEPAQNYDQTDEEDGEESEGRETQMSGFRRHYRMGVRRAHIVRSVEVDGK